MESPQPLKAVDNQTAKGLYVNTIIFAVISAIATLILLIMVLFMPAARVFTYAIVTLEAGLIAIIVYSIVSIVKYEASLKKKAQAGAKYLVTVDSCPDYFANELSGANEVVCRNGYSSLDGSRRYYFVKQGCSSRQLDKACSLDPSQKSSADFIVPLSKYSKRDAQDLCKEVNSSDNAFASVPWTNVKARCNSLGLGGLLTK